MGKRARLVLRIESSFGRQHIINALNIFAKDFEAGVIKDGEGVSNGSGLHKEYEYKEEQVDPAG